MSEEHFGHLRKKNLFKLIGSKLGEVCFFFLSFLKKLLKKFGQFNFFSYLCTIKQIKNKIMSNSKVRKQLEAIEAKTKKYSEYKKIENLLLNYQMCKAYFHDSGASIIGVAELILKEKYNLPWQLKFIRRALMDVRGKNNPMISIPQFKYDERLHDILSKFVKKNFDKMVADRKNNSAYPFAFRDLMEKNS